jgi:hypothetical protein
VFALCSSIPRSHQTILAVPPRGSATGDEGSFQPKTDVDWLNVIDLFGHEPDAIIWHRIIRYLGSSILVANDVGE